MERFSDSLKSTSCGSNNVKFTFDNKAAFNGAQREWQWLNKDPDNYVILVTEVDSCVKNLGQSHSTVKGTNMTGTRQPHKVTSASFDKGSLTATFTGSAEPWADLLGMSYRLKISSRGIMTHFPKGEHGSRNGSSHSSHQHDSRDLEKRITVDKSATIDLTHDFSGNIFSKQIDDVTASLDCQPCGTSGTLDFEIDIVPFLIPPSIQGTASLTPSGVGASFTLALTLSGELTSDITETINLASFALPGGLDIDGVIDIGPTLVVDGQADISSVSAQATLSMGVDITIPDDSVASVDFSNSANNKFTDWVPQFQPIGPNADASVSVSGSVGPQISVQLDITALGEGIGAGLVLSAPQLTLDLTAQADSSGVCDGSDVAGIEFDVNLGAELDAFGGIGAVSDFPNKVPITSIGTQLFSTCIGIGGASATSTSAVASGAPTGSTNSTKFRRRSPKAEKMAEIADLAKEQEKK